MLKDPDADVRRMAVSAVGVLSESTRDATTLASLLDLIDDPLEEWHVRDTAYEAILRVLGHTEHRRVRLEPMSWPDEADGELLAEARDVVRRHDANHK
jgi:hypothetical protein